MNDENICAHALGAAGRPFHSAGRSPSPGLAAEADHVRRALRPGGGTDAFARPLAAQLDSQLGQRVLIENKAGAGGTLGASYAVEAAGRRLHLPDRRRAPHHRAVDLSQARLRHREGLHPGHHAGAPAACRHGQSREGSRPRRSTEFIAYTQKNQVNYGSAGAGTTHHLAGEFFNIDGQDQAEPRALSRRGPAMQDLLAGHVPVVFDGLGTSAPQIAGRHAARACDHRTEAVPALPDVPTSAEAGLPGFEFSTWYGIFAQQGHAAARRSSA